MASEVICPGGCGQRVYAVPGYWGDKTLYVERGKTEVAYYVPQTKTYNTKEGFRIHQCKKPKLEEGGKIEN